MVYFKTMFHKTQLIYISEGFFFLDFICGHVSLFTAPEIKQWAFIIAACKHLRLRIYSWTPLGGKKDLLCIMHYYDLTSGGWMLPVSFYIILVVNVVDVHLYIFFLASASLSFLQLKN